MTITWLDPVGAGLSLLATYYFTKASIRAWPVSLAAILINTYLYWIKGIYGQVGLELFYMMTTFYGWYLWLQKKNQSSILPISSMPLKYYGYGIPIFIVCDWVFIEILHSFFHSTIAYWDATATLLAICAQIMTCRKWIECWAAWFIVDAMVVFVHAVKGIPFHSAIHFIYLGFAVLGFVRWKKQLTKQEKAVKCESYQEELLA